MEFIILAILIISVILGIMLLKRYKILKRIMIVFGLEVFLYLFSFLIVYVSMIIASIFTKDIDYNTFLSVGAVFTMSILMLMYCFCINKYKGTNNFIISIITSTIIFIFLLPVIIFLCKR